MRLSTLQRKLLIGVAASLILAAVLALTAVLFGDLGETGGKVLATTMALAAFSITAMAAAVPPRGREAGALMRVGIGASAVSFSLVSYFLWADDPFEDSTVALAKLTTIAMIVAVACAHAALILRGRGRGDTTDLVVTATLICSSALAALLIAVIIGEWFTDGVGRLVGALAILAVLGTLLTPLLPRIIGTSNGSGSE